MSVKKTLSDTWAAMNRFRAPYSTGTQCAGAALGMLGALIICVGIKRFWGRSISWITPSRGAAMKTANQRTKTTQNTQNTTATTKGDNNRTVTTVSPAKASLAGAILKPTSTPTPANNGFASNSSSTTPPLEARTTGNASPRVEHALGNSSEDDGAGEQQSPKSTPATTTGPAQLVNQPSAATIIPAAISNNQNNERREPNDANAKVEDNEAMHEPKELEGEGNAANLQHNDGSRQIEESVREAPGSVNMRPESYINPQNWIDIALPQCTKEDLLKCTKDGNSVLHFAIATCRWDWANAIMNRAQALESLPELLAKQNKKGITADVILQKMGRRKQSTETPSQFLTPLGVSEYAQSDQNRFQTSLNAAIDTLLKDSTYRPGKSLNLETLHLKSTLKRE